MYAVLYKRQYSLKCQVLFFIGLLFYPFSITLIFNEEDEWLYSTYTPHEPNDRVHFYFYGRLRDRDNPAD